MNNNNESIEQTNEYESQDAKTLNNVTSNDTKKFGWYSYSRSRRDNGRTKWLCQTSTGKERLVNFFTETTEKVPNMSFDTDWTFCGSIIGSPQYVGSTYIPHLDPTYLIIFNEMDPSLEE